MNKKGLVWREVALWVIALIVLAVAIMGIFIFKEKGFNVLEKLREFLRFGG